MSTLELAITIAAAAHAGQVDKGGQPYILHPLRVMMAATDPDQRIVGVLHDVLEDSPEWSTGRLRREGFSPEVIDALLALTRWHDESYEDFILRVKRNELARAVKVLDLIDNSNLGRIAKPMPADYERAKKYNRAIGVLAAE